MLADNGSLLRIFISENSRCEGKSLYEWIARQAQQHGLAGVTIVRGMEGFGSHKEIHSSKMLDMSFNLPIIVHIVDTAEKIEAFVNLLDSVIDEGLITIQPVHMRTYRSNKSH
jgi:PII-like signaling protein